MEYLLVLQLLSSSPVHYDLLLLSLEEIIRESIGDYDRVDGHDIDSGEMNIFLFTGNPKLAFERIKTIRSVTHHMSDMKVGYREIGA